MSFCSFLNIFTLHGLSDKDSGNISQWKAPLKEIARKKNPNLMQIVYGASSLATPLINENHDISDDDESDDEDFFKPKGEQHKVCHLKFDKIW